VDRRELWDQIRTFPLVAADLAEDLLSGDFRSVFKGQGIEFDEVRHYERGDDVRTIDWNVSARFGTPYVKLFREERELTVCLVVDASASMRSGGGTVSRFDQAVLAGALVALSAEQAGQRVGAILFDQGIRRVVPPRKGRSHVMALVLGLLADQAAGGQSDLGTALLGAGRLLKRRALVVVLSDFLCVAWERELGVLSRSHDVVAIRIGDPVDEELPNAGLVYVRDPETGVELHAPTGFASFRAAWRHWHGDRAEAWQAQCRRHGVATLRLATDQDVPTVLAGFFGRRRRP